jgi:hypothetical protein
MSKYTESQKSSANETMTRVSRMKMLLLLGISSMAIGCWPEIKRFEYADQDQDSEMALQIDKSTTDNNQTTETKNLNGVSNEAMVAELERRASELPLALRSRLSKTLAGLPSKQEDTPESVAEKYLGTYEAGLEKHYFKITFEKLGNDKTPSKSTTSLGNTEAKLIMPLHIAAQYKIKLPWPLNDKSGEISKDGGVYSANGKHYIVFWAPEFKQNIVLQMRIKNNKIQANATPSYNSDKIKKLFNGWVNLTPVSH